MQAYEIQTKYKTNEGSSCYEHQLPIVSNYIFVKII